MALEKSRFFDSVNGDRTYQAADFAEYFAEFLTDGIKNGGTNLQVTADGTGMFVKVEYGFARCGSYAYWLKDNNTGKLTLNLDAPDAQPRIDRIVLHTDKSLAMRNTWVKFIKGIPAVSPAAPALIRAGNIFELSLARILRTPGTTSIALADITDERYDSAVCGLINSLIQLDGSAFQAQAAAIIAALSTQGYVSQTTYNGHVDQDVRTSSSPTFNVVTATKVVGAVYK